ncbi:hypothetical protein [Geodermatophilus sp. SYSU D00696]
MGDLDGAERQRPALLALSDRPRAADAGVDSVIVSTERVAVDLFVDGDYEYVVLFWENEPGQWERLGPPGATSTGPTWTPRPEPPGRRAGRRPPAAAHGTGGMVRAAR